MLYLPVLPDFTPDEAGKLVCSCILEEVFAELVNSHVLCCWIPDVVTVSGNRHLGDFVQTALQCLDTTLTTDH